MQYTITKSSGEELIIKPPVVIQSTSPRYTIIARNIGFDKKDNTGTYDMRVVQSLLLPPIITLKKLEFRLSRIGIDSLVILSFPYAKRKILKLTLGPQ